MIYFNNANQMYAMNGIHIDLFGQKNTGIKQAKNFKFNQLQFYINS